MRQSTPDQLAYNPESRRRQYALKTRAHALGWENVVFIDDDLGRSGGGTARPGFERLLAAIVAAARARSLPSRPRAWPATGATGTPSWSSVPWWAA
ncbi:recombinase family protein [Mesorhizobium sp. M1163]|uniref:recombinase family protein n=1 Tax=Mesorhizobium sp. M1163 TaxID=2957065 RepID=UPI003335BE8A